MIPFEDAWVVAHTNPITIWPSEEAARAYNEIEHMGRGRVVPMSEYARKYADALRTREQYQADLAKYRAESEAIRPFMEVWATHITTNNTKTGNHT